MEKNKERMRICVFAAAFDVILAVESELDHFCCLYFWVNQIFIKLNSGTLAK